MIAERRGRSGVLALISAGLALAVVLTAGPQAFAACPNPPFQATLKFQNAPPNATFAPGAVGNLVLQIENCSGANVVTPDFSSIDFYRFLRFVGPKGGVINANAASASGLVTTHNINKTFFCQSLGGVDQVPNAIPVVPVETLPPSFFREFIIPVASFYDPSAPGLYQVTFHGEALVFDSVIKNCDQVPVDVADLRGSNSAHKVFRSNTLQFVISGAVAGQLDHIAISPAASFIASGGTEFYTAEGFDASNNSLGDVTATTTFSIAGGTCSGTGCTATTLAPHTVTGTNSGKTATATLTVASPANFVKVWVGLADSNDVGLRFDLKAVLTKNGSQVGSGQLGSVSGGSSGFNNAILERIPIFSASGTVSLSAGDTLEVLVRTACAKSGKISGVARLWFDGKHIDTGPARDAGSRLDPPSGTTTRLFLRSGFALRSTAGSARISVDKPVGAKCGPYQSFGIWSNVP